MNIELIKSVDRDLLLKANNEELIDIVLTMKDLIENQNKIIETDSKIINLQKKVIENQKKHISVERNLINAYKQNFKNR